MIFFAAILIVSGSCKKADDTNPSGLLMTVSMVGNALNGDIGQIGSEITLSPDIYDFEIESSTAKFGSNQTSWTGVFIYTHEIIGNLQPAPNFMTSLNGIGVIKAIDLSNQTSPIKIQGFMIPNVPTNDDSGDVKVKITRKSDNQVFTLTVSMVQNALNGDLGQIGAQISLSPGKYQIFIESSTAKFGTNQTAWEGVFLYTHEMIVDLQPAPNFMTTLNGIGVPKTIDLSNNSSNIIMQGFMVPNVPTSDDSGEVKVKFIKL